MSPSIAFTVPQARPLDLRNNADALQFVLRSEANSVCRVSDSPTRRQHGRQKIGWPATCVTADGFSWECWVVDHSIGGLGLSNCPALTVDQVVELKLCDIGEFWCRVAWSEQSRCGVQFIDDQNIASVEELEALAQLLTNVGDRQSATATNASGDYSPGKHRAFR